MVLTIDSSGVLTKIGMAKIIDKIVTPIHNSSHLKPKLPRTDTRIDDKTIPRPTPMK